MKSWMRGGGYDLVVCEGVINGNANPNKFLTKVSEFVKPGGILAITTVSPLGIVDQSLRRLYKVHAKKLSPSHMAQVRFLASIFGSHLAQLPTSKKVEDWVQDAILHPLTDDYIYSSKDAAINLVDNFSVIGSSPRLLLDFRWFKGLTIETRESSRFISQFEVYEPTFIDQRLDNTNFIPSQIEGEKRALLEYLSRKIWQISCSIWHQDSFELLSELKQCLETLKDLVGSYSENTSVAIDEFLNAFHVRSELIFKEMPSFAKWWGRGLTYVAFKKKR